MKLSELRNILSTQSELDFKLYDGRPLPPHFHLTELGELHQRYMNCGGETREERVINLQLWEGDDPDHRLSPAKFVKIIDQAQAKLGLGDHEVEVEYQLETVGRFALSFVDGQFILQSLNTDCQAKELCTPEFAQTKSGEELTCSPQSGCC